MQLMEETVRLVHEKLQVPEDYLVLFTSSATECWELIAQSVIEKSPSLHFFNGAFGEKWHQATQRISGQAIALPYGLEEQLPIEVLAQYKDNHSLIAVTHNETSNGTYVNDTTLSTLRQHSNALIAIDATSSLGGCKLTYKYVDIVYASVQKCLGQPPGLALFACSPAALERAREINDYSFYNSLLIAEANALKYQTTHTPNILGIYLLKRTLEQLDELQHIAERINQQATVAYQKLDHYGFSPLIQTPELRSDTVLVAQLEPPVLHAFQQHCKAKGLVIGKGYGTWKEHTFRLANFPAIAPQHWEYLWQCIESFGG
jgi:phosphoserine aminotransferase